MANQNLPTFTVNAGFHNRDGCPVSVNVNHPGVSQLHDHAVTFNRHRIWCRHFSTVLR